MRPTNSDLAELLAAAAQHEEGHRARALLRASRRAMFWPREAAEIVDADPSARSLTELAGVGPWIADRLASWLADPPDDAPSVAAERIGYLSLAQVRRALDAHSDWAATLRADLQMHTTETDGAVPLDEMASAAWAYGHEFIAITDHSRTLTITNGMDEERLLAQGRWIERLNADAAEPGRRILRGIEMDLTEDGRGDMDPEALGRLDLVLGAFHSKLRVSEDQTERYLAALRNPDVDVLAHPTTRMWNRRRGLAADWPRVFALAAERGVVLEIDGTPYRQDLPVPLLEIAAGFDVRFSIGSDAHHPRELPSVEFAMASAILAGIPRERILNFESADAILERRARRRAGD